MLFVIFILAEAESKSPTSLTLAESASAYQAKLVKPEYHEVEVKTGEETESNVIQVSSLAKCENHSCLDSPLKSVINHSL